MNQSPRAVVRSATTSPKPPPPRCFASRFVAVANAPRRGGFDSSGRRSAHCRGLSHPFGAQYLFSQSKNSASFVRVGLQNGIFFVLDPRPQALWRCVQLDSLAAENALVMDALRDQMRQSLALEDEVKRLQREVSTHAEKEESTQSRLRLLISTIRDQERRILRTDEDNADLRRRAEEATELLEELAKNKLEVRRLSVAQEVCGCFTAHCSGGLGAHSTGHVSTRQPNTNFQRRLQAVFAFEAGL